ncbi:MAG: hypothetical protein H0W56_06180 [Acidothermales bacterium]|nr:hypothetical protein [Acidothermales bacterium]MDQ3422527.1 hypothetical protein [Actinomycetota bacterium]
MSAGEAVGGHIDCLAVFLRAEVGPSAANTCQGVRRVYRCSQFADAGAGSSNGVVYVVRPASTP